MQPDFSALFRRDTVSELHFRVGGGPNFVHDIQFLSSYLHDGRFSPEAITRSGKSLRIAVERDCWELPRSEGPDSLELRTASACLTLKPVSSIRWEADDLANLGRELWIESIYVGAAHWETPDVSEVVISAPHQGWKLRIFLADDFGDIRLDDLEMPYWHPKRKA